MSRFFFLLLLIAFLPAAAMAASHPAAEAPNAMQQEFQVLQGFNKLRESETGILKVEARKKHRILFLMGVGLLLAIVTTIGLGLAMVLGGKPVFFWHMLSAGISLTLAIAHAVTAIVWFYPF